MLMRLSTFLSFAGRGVRGSGANSKTRRRENFGGGCAESV